MHWTTLQWNKIVPIWNSKKTKKKKTNTKSIPSGQFWYCGTLPQINHHWRVQTVSWLTESHVTFKTATERRPTTVIISTKAEVGEGGGGACWSIPLTQQFPAQVLRHPVFILLYIFTVFRTITSNSAELPNTPNTKVSALMSWPALSHRTPHWSISAQFWHVVGLHEGTEGFNQSKLCYTFESATRRQRHTSLARHFS